MSSINFEENCEKGIQYLKKSGVDERVLEYLKGQSGKGNFYAILRKLKEILGNNYFYNAPNNIELLKQGTDTFRITEDGGIWFMNESGRDAFNREKHPIRIGGQVHTFYHGSSLDEQSLEKHTHYNYIGREGENVLYQSVQCKQRRRNEKITYHGEIREQKFREDNALIEEHEATWISEESSDIPNRELSTTKKTYSGNSREWFPQATSTLNVNYSQDPKWQFVMIGKTLGERVMKEVEMETVKKRN